MDDEQNPVDADRERLAEGAEPAENGHAISARVRRLRLSTLATFRIAAQRNGWTDIIPMGGAELAFPPPPAVQTALEEVVSRGFTKYGPMAGHPDFLCLIQEKLRRFNRIPVSLEQIYCVPGAASALHVLLMALIDQGDEVLIQDPCWDHFPEMIRMAGGTPKQFRMVPDGKGHFTPDLDHLRAQITPTTRAALINTPLSPCGAVLRRREAEALLEILDSHRIVLISDEAYESFVFGGNVHVSPAEISPHVVTVHSFSKSFAVPGLSLAYISAPAPIVEAVRVACLYSFLVTSNIAQCVGAGILKSDYPAYTTAARQLCEARVEFLRDRLDGAPGLRCRRVEGGLYLSAVVSLPGVSGSRFTERLFYDKHVVSVPGDAAGREMEQDVCFFFGLDESVLAEGARRIAQAAAALSEPDLAPQAPASAAGTRALQVRSAL